MNQLSTIPVGSACVSVTGPHVTAVSLCSRQALPFHPVSLSLLSGARLSEKVLLLAPCVSHCVCSRQNFAALVTCIPGSHGICNLHLSLRFGGGGGLGGFRRGTQELLPFPDFIF